MKATAHRSLAAALAIVLAQGCDGGPDGRQAAPAPLPRHPAMIAPASGSPEGAPLPSGHPAVPGPGAAPAPLSADHPPASPAAPPGAEGREVAAGPVVLTAPEGWIRQASGQFTLAVFLLPRAEGDAEDGRITVSQAGGGVEANIARWQSQFRENPPAKTEPREVAGMKTVTVRLEGTLAGGGGPMAGGSAEKPNSKMWGTVIEIPGGGQLIFLKATGPARTMDRWDRSFGDFLSSLRATR